MIAQTIRNKGRKERGRLKARKIEMHRDRKREHERERDRRREGR